VLFNIYVFIKKFEYFSFSSGVSENDAEEPAHDDNTDDADENIQENGTCKLLSFIVII